MIAIDEVLVWLLVAFFLIGGLINWIAPERIRQDYKRWKYPGWFHYITAVLEITAAILISFPKTRLAGTALAAIVMGAAIATLILHREYKHVVAPILILNLSLLCGWLMIR